MSVTTAFNYHSPFTFCPGVQDPETGFAAVDNLTLAQVMELWWNLENIVITGESATAAGTIGGTLTLNPFGGTGELSALSSFSCGGSSLYPAGADTTAREPYERVCADGGAAVIDLLAGSSFAMQLFVGVSPTDSSKYIAVLFLSLEFSDGSGVIRGAIATPGNISVGGAPNIPAGITVNSGTLTIAGHVFDIELASWYYDAGDDAYYDGVASASAVTTLFSYP